MRIPALSAVCRRGRCIRGNLAFKLVLAACQLRVQRGNLKARALLRLLLPRRLPVPPGCHCHSHWQWPVSVVPCPIRSHSQSPATSVGIVDAADPNLRPEMLQVSWSGCDRCVSEPDSELNLNLKLARAP